MCCKMFFRSNLVSSIFIEEICHCNHSQYDKIVPPKAFNCCVSQHLLSIKNCLSILSTIDNCVQQLLKSILGLDPTCSTYFTLHQNLGDWTFDKFESRWSFLTFKIFKFFLKFQMLKTFQIRLHALHDLITFYFSKFRSFSSYTFACQSFEYSIFILVINIHVQILFLVRPYGNLNSYLTYCVFL